MKYARIPGGKANLRKRLRTLRGARSDGAGETNGASKLTEDEVASVRSLYAYGCGGKLAEIYGVGYKAIHKIVKRQRWKFSDKLFPLKRMDPFLWSSGENCSLSVLSTEQVKEIRNECWYGKMSHLKLAKKYGVHRSTIARVAAKKHWTWLDPDSVPVARPANARGETQGHHILTERDVLEIRDLGATLRHSHAEIAKMYGVDGRTVFGIIRGAQWKWLGGPRTNTTMYARGERGGTAKLTEADVLEIRRLYAAGGISQKKLGAMFGIWQGPVSLIIGRKRWGWLKDPECKSETE